MGPETRAGARFFGAPQILAFVPPNFKLLLRVRCNMLDHRRIQDFLEGAQRRVEFTQWRLVVLRDRGATMLQHESPNRLGGLGERRKLSQLGPGQSPGS